MGWGENHGPSMAPVAVRSITMDHGTVTASVFPFGAEGHPSEHGIHVADGLYLHADDVVAVLSRADRAVFDSASVRMAAHDLGVVLPG